MDRRRRCGDCHNRVDECACWARDILEEHKALDLENALSHLFPHPEVPC